MNEEDVVFILEELRTLKSLAHKYNRNLVASHKFVYKKKTLAEVVSDKIDKIMNLIVKGEESY